MARRTAPLDKHPPHANADDDTARFELAADGAWTRTRWNDEVGVGRGAGMGGRRSYNGRVTLITIELPDDVAVRVNTAAAERGVAPEQVAGEAVTEKFRPRRKVGFVDIGSSGDAGGDIARRHHEIIAADFADNTAADV